MESFYVWILNFMFIRKIVYVICVRIFTTQDIEWECQYLIWMLSVVRSKLCDTNQHSRFLTIYFQWRGSRAWWPWRGQGLASRCSTRSSKLCSWQRCCSQPRTGPAQPEQLSGGQSKRRRWGNTSLFLIIFTFPLQMGQVRLW